MSYDFKENIILPILIFVAYVLGTIIAAILFDSGIGYLGIFIWIGLGYAVFNLGTNLYLENKISLKSNFSGWDNSDTGRTIWFYTSSKYEVTLPALFIHSYLAGSIASLLLTVRTSTEKFICGF